MMFNFHRHFMMTYFIRLFLTIFNSHFRRSNNGPSADRHNECDENPRNKGLSVLDDYGIGSILFHSCYHDWLR